MASCPLGRKIKAKKPKCMFHFVHHHITSLRKSARNELKKIKKKGKIRKSLSCPMQKQHILVALVQNKSGVLNRVASLFRKRRFNIDSLNVGKTERDDISRMTIVVDGRSTDVQQVIKQLYKIVEVLKVSDVTNDETLVRETILIKVHAVTSSRTEVLQFADVFRAKAIDISADTIVFELTSRPKKVEAFLEIMRPFGIKEMVRTGVTVMNRGRSGEVKIKEEKK